MTNRVMVVHSRADYSSDDTPFPPVGAYGTVISELDEYNEFDVVFDKYPCPIIIPDDSWVTHRTMVVFIEDTTTAKRHYAENKA